MDDEMKEPSEHDCGICTKPGRWVVSKRGAV